MLPLGSRDEGMAKTMKLLDAGGFYGDYWEDPFLANRGKQAQSLKQKPNHTTLYQYRYVSKDL